MLPRNALDKSTYLLSLCSHRGGLVVFHELCRISRSLRAHVAVPWCPIQFMAVAASKVMTLRPVCHHSDYYKVGRKGALHIIGVT